MLPRRDETFMDMVSIFENFTQKERLVRVKDEN
jgi:hypothetical protein